MAVGGQGAASPHKEETVASIHWTELIDSLIVQGAWHWSVSPCYVPWKDPKKKIKELN